MVPCGTFFEFALVLREFAPVLREFALVLCLVCACSNLVLWKMLDLQWQMAPPIENQRSAQLEINLRPQYWCFAFSPIELSMSAQETHTVGTSWNQRGNGTHAAHRAERIKECSNSKNSIKLKCALVAPNCARMWMGRRFKYQLRVQVYIYSIYIYMLFICLFIVYSFICRLLYIHIYLVGAFNPSEKY